MPIWKIWFRGIGLLLVLHNFGGCGWFPAVNLAPKYEPPQYVVPDSWHGSSPFVEAKPADGALRPDWWKLYNDTVLDKLIEQAKNDSAMGKNMGAKGLSAIGLCSLKQNKMDDVLVLVGGIIPDQDVPQLKERGVAGIFQPGTAMDEIIQFIRQNVKPRGIPAGT